jgi:hypothetical protein
MGGGFEMGSLSRRYVFHNRRRHERILDPFDCLPKRDPTWTRRRQRNDQKPPFARIGASPTAPRLLAAPAVA